MDVSVGTFNLNNLFTRWNFQASVPKGTTLTETIEFDGSANSGDVRLRTFIGRVVTAKDAVDTTRVTDGVLSMDGGDGSNHDPAWITLQGL